MIAAPEQQGWQSAAGGRRDGGWCTYNSNSSDCQEEESPERVARREDSRRIRRRETAQGRQTAGRIREENKIRRNPQRLEQRETGGYGLVKRQLKNVRPVRGRFYVSLLDHFVTSIFTFTRAITVVV